MSVVVREFFTRWGFSADTGKLAEFSNALGEAKTQAVSAGTAAGFFNGTAAALFKSLAFGAVKVLKMFSGIDNLKNMMLLAASAGGALSAVFFRLAGDTAKAAQKAEQYAKALGLAPEELQEWEFALERTGGSVNAFKNGIATLADKQLAAKEGSEAAREAFQKLGVPIDDLADAKPAELFLAVSDGLKSMKNPTEIMARLIRLFGKEVAVELEGSLLKGRDAIEAFKQEGRDLGLVLSAEDFENAAKYNKALGKLKGTFFGFKNLLGKELLPVFTEFLEAKGEITPEDRKDIVDGIVKGVRSFSKALRVVIKLSKGFQLRLRWLIKLLGGLDAILGAVKTGLLFMITFQVVAIVTGFIILMSGLVAVLKAQGGALGFVRTMMIAFGRATMSVFLQMVIIPAIITAIIVLIILLLEDIKVFSEGGKSAIGDFLNSFPEVERGLEAFEDFVYGWAFRVVEAFDDMSLDIREVWRKLTRENAFQKWLDLLSKDVDRTLGELKEGFKEFALFLDGLIPDSVRGVLETASTFLESAPNAPKGSGSDVLAGIANDSRRRGPGVDAVSRSSSTSVQGGPTTINVTQQEGESGESFAKRVVRLQAREAQKLDTKRAAIVMTPVFDR